MVVSGLWTGGAASFENTPPRARVRPTPTGGAAIQ